MPEHPVRPADLGLPTGCVRFLWPTSGSACALWVIRLTREDWEVVDRPSPRRMLLVLQKMTSPLTRTTEADAVCWGKGVQ